MRQGNGRRTHGHSKIVVSVRSTLKRSDWGHNVRNPIPHKHLGAVINLDFDYTVNVATEL